MRLQSPMFFSRRLGKPPGQLTSTFMGRQASNPAAGFQRFQILQTMQGGRVAVILLTPSDLKPMEDLKALGQLSCGFSFSPRQERSAYSDLLAISQSKAFGEECFRLAPFASTLDSYGFHLHSHSRILQKPGDKTFYCVDLSTGQAFVSSSQEVDFNQKIHRSFRFSPFPVALNEHWHERATHGLPILPHLLVGDCKPRRRFWTFGFRDPVEKIFPLPFFLRFEGDRPNVFFRVERWDRREVELFAEVGSGKVEGLGFFQPQGVHPFDAAFSVDRVAEDVEATITRGRFRLTLHAPLQAQPHTFCIPLRKKGHPFPLGNVIARDFRNAMEIFMEWDATVAFHAHFSDDGDMKQFRFSDQYSQSSGTTLFSHSHAATILHEPFEVFFLKVNEFPRVAFFMRNFWHAFGFK